MGRHKEWRKIAKRERRRRIRTQHAKDWDCGSHELLSFELYEHIEKSNKDENEKWIQAEKIAMEQWKILQDKLEKIQKHQLEQEAKLKLEWELEQKRKKIEEQRLKDIEEENKRKQQVFFENLEKFLSGDSSEPPPELLVGHETKPSNELCPFFSKTACCRFGDQCSRNHQYPSISKILLATNFYVHFGLNNAGLSEYDTDIMLEYDDSETYKEFKEFFNDALPEFEKFGRVVQFKVCNNYEKHLRGNTYIEFAELRCAVAAYRSLHSRWYGGKQLSLQFCNISSWKNAICGLQLRRRCPKGRACNFLHVFRNPNNLFSGYIYTQYQDNIRTRSTPSRSWRWSESPETDITERSKTRFSESAHEENRRKEKRRERSSRSYREKDEKRRSPKVQRRSHRR